MKNMKVKEMTTLGILCAFAIVINLLAIFPLVPAVPWLTYDPKDIIIAVSYTHLDVYKRQENHCG